ncbi:hypothetical protein L6164_002085 [Bauhinia variegata]|uniref:Uncharacterized protein n=1 Tax=Bauhinia variegata TaxID=167791 RepID=A0ACB9PXA1_BAUVA|nr:hypothetical protein L6164_002085 [Bauhinia variegata]
MEGVNIITIAELLQRARPLSGTASLHLPSNRRVSHSSSSSKSNPSTKTPTPSSHSYPISRVLTVLKQPTIVVGTLTLPSSDKGASASQCSEINCLQFSDVLSTVCCDILEFDPYVIGKKIHVLSWNFIPLKPCRGFLEIIKWGILDSGGGFRIGLNCLKDPLDSFPLVPDSSTCEDSSRGHHRVYGVFESVGPISVVPCTVSEMGLKSIEGLALKNSSNLIGFLAHVLVCECRLCISKTLMTVTNLSSMENENSHSFTKLEIVYFCGAASSWHSVITKLIGNRIMLSGLKKKMVFITKKESRVMYVTWEKSVVHNFRFSKKWLPRLNADIKGKGECGSYTGIIKGVYMQGMAVELDCDVWLLLTGQLYTLPHGFRVGAIISVRNVHFVDPKFSWTKVLILGACAKTSITVESFSPLETVSHVVSQSKSLLEKFIQSLSFSSRLWVLLLVSSLRKKFDGISCEKQILGSKHVEGLAQMYASSQLPSSVSFQTQDSVFIGLCRHDANGCCGEMHCGFLKVVIPMSSFICHCAATFMRMLKSENVQKIMPFDNHLRLPSHEARFYGWSVKRIIPSEKVGIVLLGNLQIAPSTGQLQLVDSTGSIDVLIPDLPSSLFPNRIYEVMNYTIIVDGVADRVDHLSLLESEFLSCRTIFNCSQVARELNISIYVHFLWKNVKCRNFPCYPCISSKNDAERPEPGTYHLLRVSHKFPLLQKFSDESVISSKSSAFVEAILLPWVLFLPGQGRSFQSTNVSWRQTKETSEYCINGNNKEQASNKRLKLVKESTSSMSMDKFDNPIYELSACSNPFSISTENRKCIHLSSSDEISCLVSFGSVKTENAVSSAILRDTSLECTDANPKPTARKILLEFLSESFLKYQLLQIGGYYLMKHHRKNCFCTSKDSDCRGSFKVHVDPVKQFWSLSYASDEVLHYKSSSASAQYSFSSFIKGDLSKDQIEQLFLRSSVDPSGVPSDVCLYLPSSITAFFEDDMKQSEHVKSQPSALREVGANFSLRNVTAKSGPTVSSQSLCSNYLFPEGNLISLHGKVVDVHNVGLSFSNSCSNCAGLDAFQLKGSKGAKSSFCIHVLVDQHTVSIFGSVSKHAFPIGFGPGINATFHRILDVRGRKELLLLPVSFIVINSATVCDEPYCDKSSNICPTTDAYDASLYSIPSGFISELNQFPSHKHMQFRCRVIAVFILIFESKTTKFYAQSKRNIMGGPGFEIPLAGFVLDDGSSLCCCWADAERAATLLRLHEKLPRMAFQSSSRSLKSVVNDNASRATAYHLDKILKNYKRITVKNCGSVYDSPYQELAYLTSDGALRSYDQHLLMSIIVNACVGRVWNVSGTVMEADVVRRLEKEYHIEMDNNHTMQNIWAKEVSYVDMLSEAKNIMQQLLKR